MGLPIVLSILPILNISNHPVYFWKANICYFWKIRSRSYSFIAELIYIL